MSEAVKYFLIGFRNAFTPLTLVQTGAVNQLGDISKKIYKKRIQALEERYGKEQITKKSVSTEQ